MDLPPPAPPDAFSLDDDDTGANMQQAACAEHPVPAKTVGQVPTPIVPVVNSSTAKPQQQQPQTQTSNPAAKVTQNPMHAPGATAAPATGADTGGLVPQLNTPPALPHADQQQLVQDQHHAPTPPQLQQTDAQTPQLQEQGQQQLRACVQKQQPKDLTGLLSQLSDNAEAIAAAEEMLENLLSRQAALHHMGRKMEQQQVLAVLQQGQLGFDKGRPVAAVLLYRYVVSVDTVFVWRIVIQQLLN